MRTIKFRGKTKSDNQWVYGFYFKIDENHYILENVLGGSQKQEIIPKTLGQFTEIYDKNGIEIYEGDILNMRNRYLKKDNQVFKNTGEVYFEKGVFRCDQIPLAYLDELEIIGNIYDNSKISEE